MLALLCSLLATYLLLSLLLSILLAILSLSCTLLCLCFFYRWTTASSLTSFMKPWLPSRSAPYVNIFGLLALVY